MKKFTATFAFLLSALLSHGVLADTTITVQDPYIRLVPPDIKTTGGFMIIRNASNTDRLLVKAESPAANIVELHTHINENGVMKMREVASIAVKANGQTELKPGSYHVMLIDLRQPINEGDSVPITLKFDDGSSYPLTAPVRKPQPAQPAMPMPHR